MNINFVHFVDSNSKNKSLQEEHRALLEKYCLMFVIGY